MTHVLEDEFDDPGEATDPNAVKRDRWDRPLLPPVNTALARAEGDCRPFTRCTTFAKTLGNESNLTAWKMRLVAKGMAEREDLRLLARSTEVTDKAGLNEVADAAFELAGGNAGRRLGTAFHNFSEMRDLGNEEFIDPEFLPHVEAYSAALKVHGIEIMPYYIERLCAWEKFSVSGSFDNIVMWKRPGEEVARPTVLDKKGGADLSYSWLSIVVQLFCYASADGIWDQENYRWLPMPEGLRTDVALVAHVPTGRRGEEVVCDIYEIDLLPAAEACRISYEARDWLKTRGLATKLKAQPPSAQTEVLAEAAVKPKRGRPRKKVEPVVEVLEGAALDAEVKASGAPIGRCTYCGNEHVEMTCPEAPKDDNWVWPWAKPEDITVEVTTTESEIVADVALIVEDDDPFANLPGGIDHEEEMWENSPAMYEARIMDASSPGELSVIRKEAMDSGVWNDALLELGMARLAELKK